jgi:Domain of unknown function (DUF4598)
MNYSITAVPAKRGLSVESSLSSFDGRVTKQRRISNTSDVSDQLTTRSAKERPAPQSQNVKEASSIDHAGDNDDTDVDDDSDMGSRSSHSSSEVGDASEETSSDDGDDDDDDDDDGNEISLTYVTKDSAGADELIERIPPQKKPPISMIRPASDLRTRLSSFLPELQKANADLHDSSEVSARRLDEVADDEEHYIEMNLGLGVLKERKSGAMEAHDVRLEQDDSTSSSDDSDTYSTEAGGVADERKTDGDHLTNLLGGKETSTRKAVIQEVSDS